MANRSFPIAPCLNTLLAAALIAACLFGMTQPASAIADAEEPQKIEGTANPDPIPVKDPHKALLSTITFPEEMKASVYALQPDVQTPTAIAFDEQNRLYIAETHRFDRGIEDNRRNGHWVRDDIALSSTAERLAMYKKYSDIKPMEYYTKHSEKIRVLEDKDGDGKYDLAQVFADGFNDPLDGTAAGIMVANGKVYFACIPNVWMLEDTDGDLKADTRKSLQEGYGISVSLSGHDLNGFAFGPDGRIYFTIGDRAYNLKTKEGKHLYDQYAGAIFRMEPDGSQLEVVHAGLRNPKEIAFDKYGIAFSVDNNADMGDKARAVHMVEGANSGWNRGNQNFNNFTNSIDVSRRHRTPWMVEKSWEFEDINRPAAYLPPAGHVSVGPSGLAYNPGTGLAAKWDNHFFVCDFRGGASEVLSFEMQPTDLAGYSVKSTETFISGFLNTDVEFGYDGKVYVCDYTGSWKSYGLGAVFAFENPEERAKPATKEVRTLFANGIETLPADKLAQLLSHADQRVRQRAQFALAADTANRPLLLAATDSKKPLLTRLHGIWGLGQLARSHKDKEAASALATLTKDAHWRIRGQAIQALGEAAPVDHHDAIAALLNDDNANVQMLAAIAVGKAHNPNDIPALVELLEDANDTDPYLRHGAIFGLQQIIEANPKSADKLFAFANHKSAAVRRGIVITCRRLKHGFIGTFLNDEDQSVAIEAIQGINDGYVEDGRPALAAATQWLGKSTQAINNRITNAIFRVGGKENLQRMLKLASDTSLPDDARIDCLFHLRRWEKPPVADPTTGQVHPLTNDRDISTMKGEITKTLQELLLSTKGGLLAEVIETTDSMGIKVNPTSMLAHFENPKNPTNIRLAALHSLLSNKSPISESLKKTVGDRDKKVRVESFNTLAKLEPDFAIQQAHKILETNRDYDRQQLFATLATMKHPSAAEIILENVSNVKSLDPAIKLNVIEAAGKRSEPEVAKALAAYRASLDPNDPLAEWRVSMEGGDVGMGRRIFYNHGSAQCTRCHKGYQHRNGGNAGPELWNVGSLHDRAYLLESVIMPNAKTAPGYGIMSLTLNDGNIVAGKLMVDGDDEVVLQDMATGKNTTYPRSDIKATSQPMSTMPPMGGILNKREVRDVVAFLESLKDPKAKK